MRTTADWQTLYRQDLNAHKRFDENRRFQAIARMLEYPLQQTATNPSSLGSFEAPCP